MFISALLLEVGYTSKDIMGCYWDSIDGGAGHVLLAIRPQGKGPQDGAKIIIPNCGTYFCLDPTYYLRSHNKNYAVRGERSRTNIEEGPHPYPPSLEISVEEERIDLLGYICYMSSAIGGLFIYVFGDRLTQAVLDNDGIPLGMGLDPHLQKLPKYLRDTFEGKEGEAFLKQLADAVWELIKSPFEQQRVIAAAIKPQFAFYEQLGWWGMKTLHKTIELLKKKIF